MTYKKNLWASTRTHDPFFDNPEIWPTFIYRGEVPPDTFTKLPVHALINNPKKLFQKKVYVTIPQWFETFPNMSDLRSGLNRAKCGLALNDPIDWFKLRLNQPKIEKAHHFSDLSQCCIVSLIYGFYLGQNNIFASEITFRYCYSRYILTIFLEQSNSVWFWDSIQTL